MKKLLRQPRDNMLKREQYTAYKLLAPTLLVLFFVAIYPLGSAIMTSFTNKIFASDEPAVFVGLQNYAQLLSMTIRRLPPQENFTISSQSLKQLRVWELPDDILASLSVLQDQVYTGKAHFEKAIQQGIGEQAFTQSQDVIMASAERTIVRDPDTQNIVYESPVRVLPRRPFRYRYLGEFSAFGVHYVIGARAPEFILAVVDTVIFTILTVSLETVFGIGFALLLNVEFPGRGAVRALMLVPWAIPTAISSRTWQWMFQPTRAGFFNIIFEKLGWGNGQIAFLEIDYWQLPAMVMIDVWKTTPFMTLLVLAGLQLIPSSLYEAASVDGASRWRQFWSITLPLLKPTLAVALIFRTLAALLVFELFQIVLGQSRYSMSSFTYYELINNRAMGYSAASGALIFLIIFAFALFYIKIFGVHAENE